MSFKMPYWLIGGIIGLIAWVMLFLVFNISDTLIECRLPSDDSGIPLTGVACWNSIQNFILITLGFLSFPFLFLGANPNMSTAGPVGAILFWMGSALSLFVWGIILAWIIKKIKFKRKKYYTLL